MGMALDMKGWQLVAVIQRPVDANDNVLLYRQTALR
jgi:hypothetical protein